MAAVAGELDQQPDGEFLTWALAMRLGKISEVFLNLVGIVKSTPVAGNCGHCSHMKKTSSSYPPACVLLLHGFLYHQSGFLYYQKWNFS